jgi:Arc/MetJ-type ribon-helix-helix transcriptional regulator
MHKSRNQGGATRFFGVRLTEGEIALLDRFREERSLPNRSEAVRAMVRAGAPAAPLSIELPVTLRNELEDLVEDGFATDLDGLVSAILSLGLKELVRTHTEGLPAMREHARATRDRRAGRRRADHEGRGLLER